MTSTTPDCKIFEFEEAQRLLIQDVCLVLMAEPGEIQKTGGQEIWSFIVIFSCHL